MSEPASRRAGAPLTALLILLGSWALVRAALWQSPFPAPFPSALPDLGLPGFTSAAPVVFAQEDPAGPDGTLARRQFPGPQGSPMPVAPVYAGPWMQQSVAYLTSTQQPLSSGKSSEDPRGLQGDERLTLSANHQILYAAALAYAPSAAQFRRLVAQRDKKETAPAMVTLEGWPSVSRPHRPGSGGVRSWSFDGWALWREGSGQSVAAATPSPSYGASQTGAVLRYRIDNASGHRPVAYVRATRALVPNGESEAAAGLSARPIARLPFRAHAEARVTNRTGATEIRPAVFATTEFMPRDLPMDLRASLYVQAGYVGGDFSTAFADGQLKIDRDVARFDLGTAQVGAGAWGGAQKGAARLDAGPSASLVLDNGPVPARLSVDYRMRVAGDAQPGSGLAVTLTTGF